MAIRSAFNRRPLAQVAPVFGYTAAGAPTAAGQTYVPGAYNFSVVATTRGVTPTWKSDAAATIADRLRTVGPVTPGTVYPGVIQAAPNGEHFVRVSGTFVVTNPVYADTGPSAMTGIFRALARGIFQSLSFTGGTAPSDGAGLLARMLANDYSASNAPHGDRVFVAAVTTITRTVQPVAGTTTTDTTTVQMTPVAGPCIASSPEGFYLRSTPTFAASGTHYTAGTQIEFLHNTGLTSGTNQLWHVRVVSSGATGYAVFAASHAPTCTPTVPTMNTTLATTTQTSHTTTTHTTPARTSTPQTNQTTTQSGVGGGSSQALPALLFAVGGMAVVGGYYYWDDIVSMVGGKKTTGSGRPPARSTRRVTRGARY